MGGMQALEWGVMYPERVRSLVPIATTVRRPPPSRSRGAPSAAARSRLDPGWRGGDYYDAEPGEGPHRGLALARGVAQITYRSERGVRHQFGRATVEPLGDRFDLWQRFEVEGYLDYHGDKLVRRFDANTYLLLNRAMDLHDVGRGPGRACTPALARVQVPTLVIEHRLRRALPAAPAARALRPVRRRGHAGRAGRDRQPHGHDAFLLETRQVGESLRAFLADVEKHDA